MLQPIPVVVVVVVVVVVACSDEQRNLLFVPSYLSYLVSGENQVFTQRYLD